MLKIKSRIALLYSMLTIFLVVMCAVLFYAIFNVYANKEPILQTAENSVTEKKSVTQVIKHQKSGQATSEDNTVQNYFKIVFDEKNNIIYSEKDIFSDGLLEKLLKREHITKNISSKNEISLKDFLNKHNSGKVEVLTDDDNRVIGSKILSPGEARDIVGENYSNNQFKISLGEFEKAILEVLYKRAVYIAIALILIIIIINFILSKKYAVFALKPLIQFTGKVKEQSEFKGIKLIEMPEVKDEIYDLTFAYNEAMSKVKTSYENLQRLNSYASHELRNSLAVLRAKIEMDENTSEITSYIDRLTGVTNDILAMSTSKLCDNGEKVDLALICAEVVDEYSQIFPNIELKLPEDGINLVSGKEMWIERCVVNLIDNAIKFADKNKQNNKIVIEVSEDDSTATIEVYDNGIGIEESKMAEIFKPYYGTNSRVSTGIGLAYVKHVMDLHGGKVTVESKPFEYSKFLLVFKKN